MIGIINYGSGNIASIVSALDQISERVAIITDPARLKECSRIILPGVGNFESAQRQLLTSGLLDELKQQVLVNRKPLLGICLGMQLLADFSEEGGVRGLSFIPGMVRRIPGSDLGVRVPHMGWNSVNVTDLGRRLFTRIDVDLGFYFLHGYCLVPTDGASVLASVNYGSELAAAVTDGEVIFGVQFHPEKSHKNGLQLFRNFAKL